MTEDQVKEKFVQVFSPYFELYSEVWMEHFDGSRVRADYLGIPRQEFPARFVIFEIKKGFDSFKAFTKALKQAIDYKHARVIDARFSQNPSSLNHIHRSIPKFVFLLPPFKRGHQVDMGGGALRLAGRFNVGFAGSGSAWDPNTRSKKVALSLTIGVDEIWNSVQGPRIRGQMIGSRNKRGHVR